MICSPECAGDVLVPVITHLCGQVVPRDEKYSRLVLFRCDIAIPTGLPAAIASALADLVDDGTVGATPRLKNFSFGDPQTADVAFDDCSTPDTIITSRDLNFEDWNGFDIDNVGAASPYFDRAFWDTVINGGKWNFGRTTCDGKLYLFTNKAGTQFVTGRVSAFQSEDRSIANKIYEVKKGKVGFLGDPLQYFPKPFLDLASYVGTHPSLANLY